MSIRCPKCATELEQDFGLINCSGCGVLLSIDVDGNVFEPKDEVFNQDPAFEFKTEINPTQETKVNSQFETVVMTSPDEPLADFSEKTGSFNLSEIEESTNTGDVFADEKTSDVVIDPVQFESFDSENEEPLQLNVDVAPGAPLQMQEYGSDAVADPSPSATFEAPVPAPNSEPDLDMLFGDSAYEPADNTKVSLAEEVSSYANSEKSFSGPITYTLTISGIDLKETRELVEEALTHPKFNWRVEEVLQMIKGGQLQLEDLNPAKTAMLVKRLNGIKIKISWRQNVYS